MAKTIGFTLEQAQEQAAQLANAHSVFSLLLLLHRYGPAAAALATDVMALLEKHGPTIQAFLSELQGVTLIGENPHV